MMDKIVNGQRVEMTEAEVAEFEASRAVDPAEVLAAWRATATISFPQLLIGLVAEGWITEAEGLAWNAKVLPAAVTAVIASLPQGMQFAATTRALNPSIVERSNPLVSAIGAAASKSEADLDLFFQTYAAV